MSEAALIVSAMLFALLSVRHILLIRTMHRLLEENIDMKFQLEVVQARGIVVRQFTGGHS